MYGFGDIVLIESNIDYSKDIGVIIPRKIKNNSRNYDFPDSGNILLINGKIDYFNYPDNFGNFVEILGFPCLNSNLESRFLPIDQKGNSRFCEVKLINSSNLDDFIFLNEIREKLFQK